MVILIFYKILSIHSNGFNMKRKTNVVNLEDSNAKVETELDR
jgi:hypothetical protein